MNFKLLCEQLKSKYEQEKPFAGYILPDTNDFKVYFPKKSDLLLTKDFSSPGFLFAPFNFHSEGCFIPEEGTEVISISISPKSIDKYKIKRKIEEEAAVKHKQLVRNAIENIHSTSTEKIVVSRKIEVPLSDLDFEILLERLFHLYPNTFRYIWYHPETGIWCGASPEVLLKSDGFNLTTMALAGTKKMNKDGELNWNDKERREQQYVTDSILNTLEPLTTAIKISKPQTYKAGSIYHIRTQIKAVLNKGKNNINFLASILHPTPAVCGYPTQIAKRFILDNEGYDRQYYTGFLGPVEKDKELTQLFVNLRCMQIENNIAKIYVGGGITSDSVPKNELKETKNKSEIMLQVIQPFL